MNEILDYIIFIPARDNSKRVPNKNMKEINGRPLLQYSVDVAVEFKESNPDKNILVALSSNSDEILTWAKWRYSSKIKYMLRSEKLAQDHVQTDEVCRDMFRTIEMHYEINAMTKGILLQPTSPERTIDDVNRCVSDMEAVMFNDAELEHKTWCFITAEVADGFYWKKEEDLIMDLPSLCINDDPRFRLGKQWIEDVNPLMKENGAVYLFPVHNLSLYRTYRMPPYYIVETKSMVDLDTLEDFEKAERALS